MLLWLADLLHDCYLKYWFSYSKCRWCASGKSNTSFKDLVYEFSRINNEGTGHHHSEESAWWSWEIVHGILSGKFNVKWSMYTKYSFVQFEHYWLYNFPEQHTGLHFIVTLLRCSVIETRSYRLQSYELFFLAWKVWEVYWIDVESFDSNFCHIPCCNLGVNYISSNYILSCFLERWFWSFCP